jgi:hypothetical protein
LREDQRLLAMIAERRPALVLDRLLCYKSTGGVPSGTCQTARTRPEALMVVLPLE